MKFARFRRHVLLSAVSLAALAVGTPLAYAQQAQTTLSAPTAPDARANILDEVVVTAVRKRAENVQQTPITVTALNDEMLERAHLNTTINLGELAPNLQTQQSIGSGNLMNFFLRGFGTQLNDPSNDPHVAVFIDGIYMPANEGNILSTWDIGTIEVDAGPQGTLLGKNVSVGAIYITSGKPTTRFEGGAEASYGSSNAFTLKEKVNIPLVQDASGNNILAVKADWSTIGGGNWMYNLANNKHDMGGQQGNSGKIAIDFTPNDRFEWYVTALEDFYRSPQAGDFPADYIQGIPGSSNSATQPPAYLCFFQPTVCQTRLPYGQTDEPYTRRNYGDMTVVSSTLDYHFTPVTVTLVNGFVDFWELENNDLGGLPVDQLTSVEDLTRYDEETAEFRIASNKNGGWDANGLLDWTVGGYYSNFNYLNTNNNNIGVVDGFAVHPQGFSNSDDQQRGISRSEAVYFHVIAHFTDQWDGIFGVRRSWDEKYHSALLIGAAAWGYDPPAGWNANTFEAGTSYKFDDHRMAYFRFAQGYQSGGTGGFALGQKYDPEFNDEYEFGVKSDWLHNKLRVNADIFQNNLTNLQVASALPISTAPFYIQETLNAGSAVTQGAELQVVAIPIPALTTHLTAGYIDAHYNKNFSTDCSNTALATDCSGEPFPFTSKFNFSLGGDYVVDLPDAIGTATLSVDWMYKTKLYVDSPPVPASLQHSYGIFNAGVTFRDASDKYGLEIFGTNIFNKQYQTAYVGPGGVANWGIEGRPAEWGVRLTARF